MLVFRPSAIAAILFSLVLLVGCGSDDEDNPTTPGDPAYADISGVWWGNGTITSMSPGDHPLVLTMAPGVGNPSPASFVVQQDGQAISVRVTWSSSDIYTDYTGTVGEDSFTLTWTDSNAATIYQVPCTDGVERDLVRVSDSLTGTISGGTITLTGTKTENCLISSSQAADGTIQTSCTFTFTKDS